MLSAAVLTGGLIENREDSSFCLRKARADRGPRGLRALRSAVTLLQADAPATPKVPAACRRRVLADTYPDKQPSYRPVVA